MPYPESPGSDGGQLDGQTPAQLQEWSTDGGCVTPETDEDFQRRLEEFLLRVEKLRIDEGGSPI